jgi:hypothetical protein
MQTLRDKLNHAVTAYDRRRQGKRDYNFYALGLYLRRVDECCAQIDAGADAQTVLSQGFNDRLRDCVLKAAGQNLTR